MEILTYVSDFQVFLTHRCAYECGYCSLPNTPGEPLPSKKQVQRLLRTASRLGAHQITLCAGEGVDELPEIVSTCRYYGFSGWFDYLRAISQAILQRNGHQLFFPVLDVGPIPYAELRRLQPVVPLVRLMLDSADDSLQSKPAHMNAANKTVQQRLAALEDLGKIGIPTVTGIWIGIGESPDSWVRAAKLISQANQSHGHIQSFAVKPFHPVPFSKFSRRAPVTDEVFLEALRVIRKHLDKRIAISAEVNSRGHLILPAAGEGVTDFGNMRFGSSEHINFEMHGMIETLRQDAQKNSLRFCERMPFFESFLRRRELPEPIQHNVSRFRRVADGAPISGGAEAACL